MRTGVGFSVSSSDRQRLEAIVADGNRPQKHVWRARIILLSDDGLGTAAIMAVTGKSKTCVWRWQERFMGEGAEGRSTVHASPLMRSPGVVAFQILIQRGLHFLDGLAPGAAALDAEVLIQQRTVRPLHDAIGLWPGDLRALVLDALQLQKQLAGMPIHAATELAAIVGERGIDPGAVVLEDGQQVIVQGLHRRHRHPGGEQPPPGMAWW